ncbi:MAG: SGNH/GDSL hydrolase family protein [Pseudomonadota bacterium]|nr:SGNH/GDSL hydrolase family protein [Pseudomonadota bacterium]
MDTPPPRPARLSIRIAAWIFLTLVTLLLAESIARVIFPLPEILDFNRARYSPQMVSGPLLAKATLAHASYIVESLPDRTASLHTLNLYGFRDRNRTVERTAARRVLVIGDSMVEGFLTDEEHTIPRLLERLAHDAGEDVEVWNLGVGGAGLSHYIALVQDAARLFRPDEVVFVFHSNDLLGSPTFSRDLVTAGTDDRRSRFWKSRILEVGTRIANKQAVPRLWHQPPFSFFPAVPDPANPWTQNEKRYLEFVSPDIAKAMREGRFNPFNVGEVQGYEHYLRQPVDIRPWLEFLKHFLETQNVAFSVTYVPQPSQVSDYYRPFKQKFCPPGVPSLTGPAYQQGAAVVALHAKDLGIPFLDLTPVFRDQEAAGHHLYWNYDEHMLPSGYAVAAEAIHRMRRDLQAGRGPK